MNKDTIVAPATPSGRGGISIVRLSGPSVSIVAQDIFGKLPLPRYATFLPLLDENQEVIDEGIVLFFPGPHSFTGEDVLEFQGHGGPAIVDMILKRILGLGVRLARPGEFSERAFLNNKIDLAQAEAIADLIDATTEQAARASMRSLQGEFSKNIHSMVESVIRLRMYIEAAIDFVEEEIDFLADKQILTDLNALIHQLEDIQAKASQGSLLREGIAAVIVGQPNVGKSTLLNQLSGKDIAIVTDIPGTTRDLLHHEISVDGLAIHFIDTAGLRESDDVVEQEGIRRARAEIMQADLILYVVDNENYNLEVLATNATKIIVRNKIDLRQEPASIKEIEGTTVIALSAKTGQGIELLKEHIKKLAGYNTRMEGIFSARRRHLDALERAKNYLIKGKEQLSSFKAGELLAEDLRQAQQALNEITGEFTTDDLFGRIFSSFCIGK